MTTRATLRPQWTKAQSVYHVRPPGNWDVPTSLTKDTRLEAVGCRPWFGAGPAHDFRLGPLAPRPAVPAHRSPSAAFANLTAGFPAGETQMTVEPGETVRAP